MHLIPEIPFVPDPESYNVDSYDVPSYPNDDRRCTMLPSERDTPPPADDQSS
ncbi:MAG: hypothetical protein NTX53_21760 [candidate division WOR-3 bacterium]|nr:hypothetical protein [candidate division WOR-3 bacterium]